jgi:predicted amidohydrolase YtcJ
MNHSEPASDQGISLLLRGATVLTMDPHRPTAHAVAVRGDKIVAVGEAEAIVPLASPATMQLDCHGMLVIPGFIDAHAHILAQAATERYVDCSQARSVEEIVGLLRQASATRPRGAWLRAVGYHDANLRERRHPTRFDLDRAATDRPIRLTHQSGHASVLNTAALTAMGIDARAEESTGATIARSSGTGEPSGLLLEMEDVLAAATPGVPPEAATNLLRGLSGRLLAQGVTSIQDLGHRNDRQRAEFMAGIVASGAFRPRLTMATGFTAFERGEETSSPGIGRGPVKIMLNETGMALVPDAAELTRRVGLVHHAGRQAAIHAIGRTAISAALDAVEQSQVREGRFYPHRIEHASLTNEDLSLRMAALGVAAVSNPAFIWQSGDRYADTLPPEDLPYLYDVAGLRALGVLAAGGSDCPVAPPDPMLGVNAARTRRTSGGRRISGALLSRDDAIELFTRSAAQVALEGEQKGCIREGLLADFAVLEDTPAGLKVRSTILGGEVVWTADGSGKCSPASIGGGRA